MTPSKIGIIATSSPGSTLAEESKERGLKFFHNKSIELQFADNVFYSGDYVAGTVSERLNQLENFLKDPSLDLLMAFWGGNQTHELLPYLSPDIFRSQKPIVGYSDLTPLFNYLATKGHRNSHLGPAFITFCKPHDFPYSWDLLEKSLSGEAFTVEPSPISSSNIWYKEGGMRIDKSAGWKTFREGTASGRAMGGNIGSMLLTAATPYWPDLDGCILFLEEDESESIETIDRLLTQLEHMGVYEKICGIVIGRYCEGIFRSEEEQIRLYNKVFRNFRGPIIYNCDFGHSDPLFTIPLGRIVTLTARGNQSDLRFESVEDY